MSRRLKSAEESARLDREATKTAACTLAADSAAPRDPLRRAEHYRRHLIDAQRNIETLQAKIDELEKGRAAIKRDAEYALSLCVGKSVAEEARLGAFRLAREKAAILMEAPGGQLTPMSEAIREIPDLKPKWS